MLDGIYLEDYRSHISLIFHANLEDYRSHRNLICHARLYHCEVLTINWMAFVEDFLLFKRRSVTSSKNE